VEFFTATGNELLNGDDQGLALNAFQDALDAARDVVALEREWDSRVD
jgi:hypothetical protein